MNSMNAPRFDLSQMGTADRQILASTFLEAVKRFYEDPANHERFEKWQKEKAHYAEPVKETRTRRKGRC